MGQTWTPKTGNTLDLKKNNKKKQEQYFNQQVWNPSNLFSLVMWCESKLMWRGRKSGRKWQCCRDWIQDHITLMLKESCISIIEWTWKNSRNGPQSHHWATSHIKQIANHQQPQELVEGWVQPPNTLKWEYAFWNCESSNNPKVKRRACYCQCN